MRVSRRWGTRFVLGFCGWLFVFFFEGEVGGGGAGGDLGLMGHACGYVDDVSGVKDGFFSAFALNVSN
jgi:hypothetical protein